MEPQIPSNSAQYHLIDLPDNQAEEEDDDASKDFLEQNLQVDRAIQRLDEKLSSCWMIIHRLWLTFRGGNALAFMICCLVESGNWELESEYGNCWKYNHYFPILGDGITVILSCIFVWIAAYTKSCGIIDKAILILILNIIMTIIGAILTLKEHFESPISSNRLTHALVAPFMALLTLAFAIKMKSILKERKLLADVSSFDAIEDRLDPSMIDWEVQRLDKKLSTCPITFYKIWLILVWIILLYLLIPEIRAAQNAGPNVGYMGLWVLIAIVASAIPCLAFAVLVWMAVRTKSLAKIEKAVFIYVLNLVHVSIANLGLIFAVFKEMNIGALFYLIPIVSFILHLLPALYIRNILRRRKRFTDISETDKENSQPITS